MMSGDTASGDTIDMKISDSSVYGVGLGINLTDNFNLNTDFLFGITDIDATDTYEEISVSGDSNLSLWNINLDYYVFKDRLTPMVTAGFGFVNFSSNFMGFNFDETDFSYNFGVGARWDATDNLFVKALYKWTFTKLKDTDSGITFDGLMICAGLRCNQRHILKRSLTELRSPCVRRGLTHGLSLF